MEFASRVQHFGPDADAVVALVNTGGALLLSGPVGSGRTTLLALAAATASASGGEVRSVPGDPLETPIPYAGLQRLVGPDLHRAAAPPPASCPPHSFRAPSSRGPAGLPSSSRASAGLPPPSRASAGLPPSSRGSVVLPSWQRNALWQAVEGLPVGGGRLALGLATLGVLRGAVRERPLLLLVDDAQHLDQPSWEVLTFVARRLAGEPITLIATVPPGHPTGGLPERRLVRWDAATSRRLLAATVPGLPADVAAAVADLAGGSPGALSDLAGALTPAQRRGDAPAPVTLPPHSPVATAFREVLSGLPAETRNLVLIAAAADDLHPADLHAVALQAGAGLAALAPAEQSGLLSTAGPVVTFPEPVTRAVAYHDAPLTARRAAHDLLATTFARSGRRLPALIHRAAATAAPDEALSQALIDQSAGAPPRAAATALEHAARLTAHPASAASSLLAAARHAWTAGQHHRATLLLRATTSTIPAGNLPSAHLPAGPSRLSAPVPASVPGPNSASAPATAAGPTSAPAAGSVARPASLAGSSSVSRPIAVSEPAAVAGSVSASEPASAPGPATASAPAIAAGPATASAPATVAGPAAVPEPAAIAGPASVPGPGSVSAGAFARATWAGRGAYSVPAESWSLSSLNPGAAASGGHFDQLACGVARLDAEMRLRDGAATVAGDALLDHARRLGGRDVVAAAEALVLAGETRYLAGRHDGYQEIAREMAALPRPAEAGPALTLAFCHVAGLAAMFRGDHAAAFPELRRVVELADQVPQPAALIRAAMAGLLIGDGARAASLAERAVALARARHEAALVPQALEISAFADLSAGRYEAATAAALDGVALAQACGQPRLAQSLLGTLAVLAALAGDRETCRLRIREAAVRDGTGGPDQARGLCQWALAVLDLVHDRPQATLDRLRSSLVAAAEHGNVVLQVAATLHLAEATWRCGEPEPPADAALKDAFEDWAAVTGKPSWLALRSRCRALRAAGEDEAEHHFREALDLHAEGDADFPRAHTELLFGRELRRRRRPGAARDHLRSALETFHLLDAHPWAEQADGELRAAGEHVERAATTAALPLTAQQERIARLVADGATNREVAARMYLSPRTVDHHLRNVFIRLGVRSRTELARLMVSA